VDFLECAIKMQHLCLLRCALDQAKTYSNELLVAWLLQVQQFYQTHANKTSWVHHGAEPLMTTTTTDMCLVHQIEAHSNHCVVAKSEMCLARSDLKCADYHVCIDIM
jgi:hypothetical protein